LECASGAIHKDGIRRGRQRYRCKACGYRFQGKNRPERLQKKIWESYVHQKQTYSEIAAKFKKSTAWVRNKIDGYDPPALFPAPQKTPLIIDGFYFEKHKGVLVFRSPTLKKNLGWWEIEKETVEDYELGIAELRLAGFEITGVTVDGKPGAIQKLEKMGLPVQMCHFHQIAIVTRYTTRHPRFPAAIELKELVQLLPGTDRESFEYRLNEWHEKWKDFLNEKTFDFRTEQYRFTHDRLRKAYRSLKRHMPYLFTYLSHKDLPNTTNSLDGFFAHLRDKLNIHRGLKWHRRMKVLNELLR
jgi:hypothetical protein